MTGTSEVEAQPTAAQSQDPAASPARNISQQPESHGKTGDGDAGDGQVWAITDEVRAKLAEDIEPAKRRAKTFAEDQKTAGAQKIADIAHVVHTAAGQLHSELPKVAKSVENAADALAQAATALRERSVDDVIDSCVKFARAQPAAFFAAATLTGFAVARFLRSSAERARSNDER